MSPIVRTLTFKSKIKMNLKIAISYHKTPKWRECQTCSKDKG